MGQAADEKGDIVGGKYRLVRPLAQGGMGSLWLGEHVELQSPVVLKRLLQLAGSEDDVSRFRREARIAARLTSRHIVRVFDFGVDDKGPYLAMERLVGRDLAGLLDKVGALPIERASRIFREAAKATGALHQSGILHRDIKPSNLFLAEEDGEIVTKLLDFGIVKQISQEDSSRALTASGVLVGSPGYMSPEQVRGQALDVRSDVWALAVVLYEMVTGLPPFLSEHPGDSLVRVCAGEYVPATRENSRLEKGWDEYFKIALSVLPGQRFPSVEIMVMAFELLLEGHSEFSHLVPASAQSAGRGPMPRLSTTRATHEDSTPRMGSADVDSLTAREGSPAERTSPRAVEVETLATQATVADHQERASQTSTLLAKGLPSGRGVRAGGVLLVGILGLAAALLGWQWLRRVPATADVTVTSTQEDLERAPDPSKRAPGDRDSPGDVQGELGKALDTSADSPSTAESSVQRQGGDRPDEEPWASSKPTAVVKTSAPADRTSPKPALSAAPSVRQPREPATAETPAKEPRETRQPDPTGSSPPSGGSVRSPAPAEPEIDPFTGLPVK